MAEELSSRLGDWTPEELEAAGRDVLKLIRDYFEQIEEIPVLTQTSAGQLRRMFEAPLPAESTPFEQILLETRTKVIPNLTHWNHPNFFAYFATTGSGPGILADALTSALNVQAMLWKTGPAASALEGLVLRWMAEMIGYDTTADGVLINGASLATFYALAAAREATGFDIREEGMIGRDLPVMRVYCTEHAHSSIDKAVIALGLGLKNLVKIPGDEQHRMRPDLLDYAIRSDMELGFKPMAVVAVAGTTSTGAADPLGEIGKICRNYGIWLHLDGAYGGLYNAVPEIKAQVDSFDVADSVVINPHKVLFTPLEVTALYCKRKGKLAATFSLVPEYLRTEPQDGSINYMDYSLQLGRSFRALKLWWIIRSFGVKGIAARMAEHRRIAGVLEQKIDQHPHLVRVSHSPYPLVCFRLVPEPMRAAFEKGSLTKRREIAAEADRLTAALMEAVNQDGRHFVSHTVVKEGFILRVAIGNIRTTDQHVEALWQKIEAATARLLA